MPSSTTSKAMAHRRSQLRLAGSALTSVLIALALIAIVAGGFAIGELLGDDSKQASSPEGPVAGVDATRPAKARPASPESHDSRDGQEIARETPSSRADARPLAASPTDDRRPTATPTPREADWAAGSAGGDVVWGSEMLREATRDFGKRSNPRDTRTGSSWANAPTGRSSAAADSSAPAESDFGPEQPADLAEIARRNKDMAELTRQESMERAKNLYELRRKSLGLSTDDS